MIDTKKIGEGNEDYVDVEVSFKNLTREKFIDLQLLLGRLGRILSIEIDKRVLSKEQKEV